MKKISSLLFLLVVAAPLTVRAQTPAPTVRPADEETVVRITTNLIQIDAIVTDKEGEPVTNLRPEDFELLVNGKPQTLTNFSLVTVEPARTRGTAEAARNPDKDVPPVPPSRLRPEQIKRTIALVVDDLTLAYENMSYVKKALRKFVDEQMQPGDMVAIVRTGSGVGALQQFTSDKRHLYAAIESLKYNQLVNRIKTYETSGMDEIGGETRLPSDSFDRGIVRGEDPHRFREDVLGEASLSATGFIISGMRNLPGRKAVLLISEGFVLFDRKDPGKILRTRQAIERLIDNSNRAGVVIYTMDARTLVAGGVNAADTFGPEAKGAQAITDAMIDAREKFQRPRDALVYAAERTGGFAVYDSNDLSTGIRKVLDDQKSYYLLGFQPDGSVFEQSRARFNDLTVKVKRPGLRVRYRSGFFGIKDEETKAVVNTPEQQVMRALTSPFASDDIALRLTPLFGNDARAGSYVRALVHIGAEGLTFTEKAGGLRESRINIVAYTFGYDGRVVDSTGETHTITLPESLYRRALQSGLVYSLNVPVKRAGAYQLRVAVRDDQSEKVGSASQFINVPDISKARLALSGIALSSADMRQGQGGPSGQEPGAGAPKSMLTQAALRRFRTGHLLQFAYAIYNAKLDKTSGQPRLLTQVKLLREGKEIYAGQPTAFKPVGQADFARLVAEGGLQLGGLEAGEYVLQVVMTDLSQTGPNRTATGWIDFEVER